MKKMFAFLLIFSLTLCMFSGCGAKSKNKKVTVKPSGKDDTLNLKDAFDNIADGGEVTLTEGTYYLDEEIKLDGKKNIKITGHNTTIIRTGVELKGNATENNCVFYFNRCENVNVSNITIKYEAVTSVSGVVTQTLPDSGMVVIKPNEGQKPLGDETYGALNTFDELGNPDTTLEKYSEYGFNQTLSNDGSIFLSGLSAYEVNLLKVGTRIGLRASLSSDPVIKIVDTSNTVFENVTVNNSFSGAFFIDGRSFNLTLRKVTIAPENENSYFSSNADGLHVGAMGGELLIEDCTFIKLGDDCVNVHGMAYTASNISGNSLIGYSDRYKQNVTSFWANVGDVIEFYDKDTFKLLGTATLKEIKDITGRMTFDKLPSGVKDGTIMSNKTLHPTVKITGCTVSSNRARAFLLQTEGALVENCNISGTRLAAVLISPDINYWYEMSPGRNITITNNVITNCGKAASAAIVTNASHDTITSYPADVNRNITITNNTFNNCLSAVNATSVNGLKFNDNTLNNLGGENILYAVNYERCANITIGKNTLNNCTVELYKK